MATAHRVSGTTTPGRSARAGRKRDGIPWDSPLTQVVKGALYRVFGWLELPAGYRYTTVFIPTISLDATWVKSNKGMKSSTKPVPFSQPSAIVIEFVASLHVLAKKMYDAGIEERKKEPYRLLLKQRYSVHGFDMAQYEQWSCHRDRSGDRSRYHGRLYHLGSRTLAADQKASRDHTAYLRGQPSSVCERQGRSCKANEGAE